MKREITVKLDDKEVVIKKLPIGKYAEFFLAIEELPGQFQKLNIGDKDTFLAQIIKLLTISMPDAIKIVALGSGMEVKEIEKLGFDEVTDLIVAILEVNNYEKIISNIKKIVARKSAEVNENSTGSKTGSIEPSTS